MARILVDLLGFTGERGGTETYARELLTRLPGRMPDVTFSALTGSAGADRVRGFFPGEVRVQRHVGPSAASWALGELFAAEAAARRTGADLLWTPQNFGPVVRGLPRVATIHDVIYDEVRGTVCDRAFRAVTAWLMRRSARTADEILTVSDAAARGIVGRLGIAPERIHVVPNGSTDPVRVDDPWRALRPLGVTAGRPLLLSTGNRMPHKNFAGLLRALAAIEPARRPLAVLPGAHGEDPLAPLVAELGLRDDVVLPGWVSREQLHALYAVADLYACPSLAEGFGLPVADALRHGTRVLAHDIPVLREVGGDVATYADATDPSAFGAAIAATLAQPDDAPAHAARAAHAARFTWDAAADGTAAVLTAALDDGARRTR